MTVLAWKLERTTTLKAQTIVANAQNASGNRVESK